MLGPNNKKQTDSKKERGCVCQNQLGLRVCSRGQAQTRLTICLGFELSCFRIGFIEFWTPPLPPSSSSFSVGASDAFHAWPLDSTSNLSPPHGCSRRWFKEGNDFLFSCFRFFVLCMIKFFTRSDLYVLFVFVCGVEKKGRGIYTLVLLFGKEKESLDRRLLRRPRRGSLWCWLFW